MLPLTAIVLTISCASCKLSTQTRRTRGGVVGQKFTPPFLFHHPDNQQTLKLHTFRAMKIKTAP
jgi:hypothetical protein